MGSHSDPSPQDLAAVSMQLRVVAVGLVRRLRASAEPGELTWSDEAALLRLDTSGPLTVTELARAEGTRSQSMGGIVAKLEAQGLVLRSDDASDGRRIIVAVSDHGRRALAEARTLRQDWLTARMTEDLTADEQAVLAEAVPLLQRLLAFGD